MPFVTSEPYYRARYYDPSTGRFVNEDPLEFIAGINFYDYVVNNPINLIDPSGFSPKPVKPYRWRYCTGAEVAECKQNCETQGKRYESCMVSQRFRIGPKGWTVGPEWVDGPVSCSCSERDECPKAKSNPKAAQDLSNFFITAGVGVGVGAGLAIAPEVTLPLLPALPKLVPSVSH